MNITIRILFLLLFFPTYLLQAQWVELSTSGIQGNLYGVSESSNRVIAVGEEGIFHFH